MRSLVLALASLALVSSAAVAQAPAKGTVRYIGDISDNGEVSGFPVGPYAAAISNYTPFKINSEYSVVWCIDMLNEVNFGDDQYFATAFSSNSFAGNGDFSRTRAVQALGLSNADAATRYKQAAWIIEQNLFGRAGFSGAANVQATLWLMMGATPTGVFTDLRKTDAYVAIKDWSTVKLMKDWFVLSDDNSECNVKNNLGKCVDQEVTNQEYMTFRDTSVVPEPSTYALLGGGLVALAMVGRRRRRMLAAAAPLN